MRKISGTLRLQAAIVAGIDPAAVKEPMNAAQAQREAARVALAAEPPSGRLDVAEVYAMIGALGDVGEAIKNARPDSPTKALQGAGHQGELPPRGQRR
jgi:hypothetical protein